VAGLDRKKRALAKKFLTLCNRWPMLWVWLATDAKPQARSRQMDANQALTTLRDVRSEDLNAANLVSMARAVDFLIQEGLEQMARDYMGEKLWKMYLVSKLNDKRYTKADMACNNNVDGLWASNAMLALVPIFGMPAAQSVMGIHAKDLILQPKRDAKHPWRAMGDEGWISLCSDEGIALAWSNI